MICSRLLLMNNALVPWFILVPEVQVTEFHDLPSEQQHQLLDEINALSGFIMAHFGAEKINLGAIGNKVRQLHIHVIGRFESDAYWPGVVWGAPGTKPCDEGTVRSLRVALAEKLTHFSPDAL